MLWNKSSLEKRMTETESVMFSSRSADIFAKMYLAILSVNLKSDSAMIEMGGLGFCGERCRQKNRFSGIINTLLKYVHPDDRERFSEQLSCENLYSSINSPAAGFSGVFMLQVKTDDPDDSEIPCILVEFRADAIPEDDGKTSKCILYMRKVESRYNHSDSVKATFAQDTSNYICYDLLGIDDAIFLDYDVNTDEMTVISPVEGTNVIKHYYENLKQRGGWSVSVSDISEYRKLLQSVRTGKPGSMIIKCRPSAAKSSDFKYYSLFFKPCDDFGASKKLHGVLRDIDEQYSMSRYSAEMSTHIGTFMIRTMFELDVQNCRLSILTQDDNGAIVTKKAVNADEYLKNLTGSGRIHHDYIAEFEQWTKPGFLRRMTGSGNYDIEASLRIDDDREFRWYFVSVCPLKGNERYLCLARDFSNLKSKSERRYAEEKRTRTLEESCAMLDAMASLVEFRNVESGDHVKKVRELTAILLADMAERSPDYGITEKYIDNYSRAATTHDIGKIAIPDTVLNKPGKLTAEEYDIMRRHTEEGARILECVPVFGNSDFVSICRDAALHHHERYDGSGYPEGLVGDENSIGVQAIGLADAFDALISVRCYKDKVDSDSVISSIIDGDAGSFNPRLIESFIHCCGQMVALYE